MHSYKHVNQYLSEKNGGVERVIERMELQEKQAANPGANKAEESKQQEEEKKDGAGGKKWKQKFIKIWQYNEQLERTGGYSRPGEENEQVGPINFVPIMKLGQGSFGQVFLVEKINVKPDGTQAPTGKHYAMKILNKKQIMGNNLVKYAKTERDVMSYTKHPFIVGFKYAF